MTSAIQVPPVPVRSRQAVRRRGRPSPGLVLVVLTLLVSFAALGVVVARSPHDLNNIDGISYISIAEQYADGYVSDAVNAYWSPLISWLAAPLMALGMDGIVALVTISALSAACGLTLGAALVWRVTGGHVGATLVFTVGASALYLGATRMLTPDLLVVSWTTGFVAALVMLGEALDENRRVAAWATVLGAVCVLGYVTKLFLVPVGLVSLLVWFALRALRTRRGADRRQVLLSALLVVVVASLLAAPWVVTLSLKYGHPTIGSSFSVNMSAKVDPEQSASEPLRDAPLWAPPNEHAISFGEDRTFQVTSTQESAGIPATERLRYYVSQRVAALPYYLERIRSIAPWAVPTTAVLSLALLLTRRRERGQHVGESVVVVFWVYLLGYAGVTTAATAGGNARYYWPLLTLSLIGAAWALPPFWRRFVAPRARWRRVVVVVLVAVLPVTAIWQHVLGRSAPFSTVSTTSGLGYLSKTPQAPALELLAGDLASTIPAGSAFMGSNYRASLRLAYYLDAQVYGRASQGYDVLDADFQQRLRRAEIDFYLTFTPQGTAPPRVDELGDVVATITAPVPCADTASAVVEQCTIQVIEIRDV